MTVYQTCKSYFPNGSFTDDKLRRPSYSFFDEDENDFNILVNTENFHSILLKLIELFQVDNTHVRLLIFAKVSQALATESLMTSFVTRPMHSLMRST